jgi:hypothetical protein
MASSTDVCNRALAMVGEAPITNLSLDTSNQAKVCNQVYEFVRDSVFSSFPWNCLQHSTTVAASTTGPTSQDYTYRYQIPTDSLGITAVYTDEQWRVEGDYILTDAAAPLYIRYTQSRTDPTVWKPYLRELVAVAIAAEIAPRLTQSSRKVERVEAKLKEYRRIAVRADASEGSEVNIESDPWVDARGSSWSKTDWAT